MMNINNNSNNAQRTHKNNHHNNNRNNHGDGGNNGNTHRGSNTIKVKRGSTTILEGEYGFRHIIDSDDSATTAVRVVPDTGGQMAFSVIDTNVAAGSNTYTLQVKGQIARTAKATLSAINLMK